jgi:hypothetical protein
LNTLQGYAISLLLFTVGIAIPSPATVNEIPSKDQQVLVLGSLPALEVAVVPEIVGGPETLSDANRDQTLSLKEYPPVRTDHPGQRKPVPKDPAKRCPQWEDELAQYGLFPIETWSYIMWRESGCRPKIQNAKWDANGNIIWTLNKNGSYDTGLLQINSSWRSRVAEVCGDWAIENRMQGLRTVDCNLRVARFIMNNSEGGLSNWSM